MCQKIPSHRPIALLFSDCGIPLDKTRDLRPVIFIDDPVVSKGILCVGFLFVVQGFHYRPGLFIFFCLIELSAKFVANISLCLSLHMVMYSVAVFQKSPQSI